VDDMTRLLRKMARKSHVRGCHHHHRGGSVMGYEDSQYNIATHSIPSGSVIHLLELEVITSRRIMQLVMYY